MPNLRSLKNFNHLVAPEAFSRIRRLHREFIYEMHPYFGVEPTYVEDIKFIEIFGGGHHPDVDGKPVIYFSDYYARARPDDHVFGALDLDRVMLHESGHHLHHKKHGDSFTDDFILELIMDYSAVYYFHLKGMHKHIEVMEAREGFEALDLYHGLGNRQDPKSLLTLPQERVLRICSKALGSVHPYLRDRRNARRRELRELKKKKR